MFLSSTHWRFGSCSSTATQSRREVPRAQPGCFSKTILEEFYHERKSGVPESVGFWWHATLVLKVRTFCRFQLVFCGGPSRLGDSPNDSFFARRKETPLAGHLAGPLTPRSGKDLHPRGLAHQKSQSHSPPRDSREAQWSQLCATVMQQSQGQAALRPAEEAPPPACWAK